MSERTPVTLQTHIFYPFLEKPCHTRGKSQNLSPLETFYKVFSETLLCNIAQETNRYYSQCGNQPCQRYPKQVDVNETEILIS